MHGQVNHLIPLRKIFCRPRERFEYPDFETCYYSGISFRVLKVTGFAILFETHGPRKKEVNIPIVSVRFSHT